MNALVRRKWSLAALILGLGAISAEMISKTYTGRAVAEMARRTPETASTSDLAAIEAQLRCSTAWTGIGLLLAVVAIGCWTVSRSREPEGFRTPLFMIIFLYIAYLFLMV